MTPLLGLRIPDGPERAAVVDTAVVYDSSRRRTPFRVAATFHGGRVVGEQAWPEWAPRLLRALGD